MKIKIMMAFSFLALVGFIYAQNSKPWVVPEKYQKMANPVKSDDASLKEGKALWTKHCSSCHGKLGAGDGPKAAKLKTQPEDMKSDIVQKQSDGALFYKTLEGRDDMPEFKKKLPDQEEIWHLVNYIRSFKK